jgi:hypothetical protein
MEKKAAKEPIKIIFDTDMGSDCDDVGALALLHQYEKIGKAEIIACIYSSGKVPYGAGVIDAINTYFDRSDIPVGANHSDKVGDPVDKMNAEKFAYDTATFGHRIIHNRDADEQTRLNRRTLASQKDHSVTYITVGHTKAFYDLLVSEADDISPLNGEELIKQKVSRWVALGALKANNSEAYRTKDWNFFFNGTAPFTKYLVDHNPVPSYFVHAGGEVMTGKSLKSTTEGNIVRRTYEEWLWNVFKKTLDDQRPSWDIITVYFAVEGLGQYLQMEHKGWLDFDPDSGCVWVKGVNERQHYYVIEREDMREELADYLNSMIAKSP